VLYADVAAVATDRGIPVHTQVDSMSEPALLEALGRWRPELMLVVGWYHFVPASIRALAPVFGMHSSLLPDYSGGAPLVWALINDEHECGITLFQMDAGVDSGPIAGQVRVPIRGDDTIATLHARVEEAGLALLSRELPRLCRGEATLVAQDEAQRRRFPQRGPEDGVIDWNWPARRIYNFVRAQTRPYPGAFTYADGRQVFIWRAALTDRRMNTVAPGTTMMEGSGSFVVCGDHVLLQLLEIEGEDIGARMRFGRSSVANQRL
jgi:methionyl-tRNA formyltransferase